MGFPSALSNQQKITTRTSDYWQRTFVAFNPGEIVFQAEINEDLSSAPFKQFVWTNTLEGAYSDVLEGMVCYLSDTTDFAKDYIYRGRVRLAPSATTFYIDLNASTVATGQIVTVIRDADLFARVREADLVDGSIVYHNLPPMISGLPSVLCLYDSDNDGLVSYTTAQSGIAVANGASIVSWLWTISGNGTTSFTSGSSTSQNPTIQFQAGYHYLLRCRAADSNAVSHYVFVQIYAITRTFGTPAVLPAVAGNISQTLDNGYTGSIVAYSGVSELPYRTHAAVFCVERFGDNSSTPMNTNILMHGRLRSESLPTEGSEEAGVEQQVTYAIEGITAYMQRLKLPNDIVRHTASPNEWGEMTYPTPYRMAVYALFAYSNLLNLCSFSAGDSQFAAWRRGGEPVSVDGGFAMDTLKSLLSFVDAAPNFAPDGEIRCEIDASHKVDRSALSTIMDFTTSDARSVTLDIDTSKTTSQVIGYGAVWNSTNNTMLSLTASAPSVPFSDAPETREQTRLLLKHDVSEATAITEVETRTGNEYAFQNPKWLIDAVLRDAHRWIVATNYQRYTWTLAASDNTRGIPVTTSTKLQCQSVDITINTDGTFDVNAQFIEETEFSDAQSLAHSLPVNLTNLNPVTPVLSDYPAFPDDPLWGFPTDTPTTDEYQPIDPYSAYLAYAPFTPDQAAKAAQKQGTANCKPLIVNLRNSSNVQTSWNTVNAAGYTIRAQGEGDLGVTSASYNDPLTTVLGARTHLPSASYPIGYARWDGAVIVGDFTNTEGGEYVTTGGFGGGGALHGTVIHTNNSCVNAIIDLGVEQDITQVTWRGKRVGVTSASEAIAFYDGSMTQISVTDMGTTGADYELRTYATPVADCRYIVIAVDYNDGDAWLDDITVDYDALVRGDAFYYGYNVEAGGVATAYSSGDGLQINNADVSSIPPYSPSHSYQFPFTGNGSPLAAKFGDSSSYSDNDNANLYLLICRNG
jgi:hypothetical protein